VGVRRAQWYSARTVNNPHTFSLSTAYRWTSIKDVARVTGRGVSTIRRWKAQGAIVTRAIARGRAVLVLVDAYGLPVDAPRAA
jgi:hypothetical protein